MNGMISTILIDIDDTLLDFNLCAEWAMEETAKKMKLLLPQNTYDYFKKNKCFALETDGEKRNNF